MHGTGSAETTCEDQGPGCIDATSHLGDVCKSNMTALYALGVRSLANASRARQFNPLNPPGVGWVKKIIFLR